MSANTDLRVTELDFDQIKSNLKNFMRSQSEFEDFDFDGSGMSVLLDILSYNTFYQGAYLNAVGSEMFLDSAQLSSSIISHARNIGYVPSSMKSPVAIVNIKVTPSNLEDQDAGTLTLPKFTNFQSQAVDGINYNFVTIGANNATKDANSSFNFANVTLLQADVISKAFTISGDIRSFDIPSSNVDTDHLFVTIQASSSNTQLTNYTEAEDLTELTANSLVYFVEENSDANGSYNISFGDGIFGNYPANGSIVTVTYLNTSGQYANKANAFILLGTINGYNDNVIITPVSSAAGGAPREDIETTRIQAPLFYTTQNRAVTVDDYNTLILKDYPFIDAVAVWGGADNDPPVYGKVFISLKPKEGFEISVTEQNRIITDIISTRSVLTVTPEIVDPDFTYIQLKITVHYDPSKTSMDENQLATLVRQTVLSYNDQNLNGFNSVFRSSKLQTLIDKTDQSFTSSEMDVFLQKRTRLTIDRAQTYTFEFLTSMRNTEFPNQPYSYPGIFQDDNQGISRLVFFEITPRSDTGINSISVLSPGMNYTEIPIVTIVGDGTGAQATAHIVNGRVTSVDITSEGIDYTRASVSIIGNGQGATAQAILSESIGIVRSFYYLDNGQKQILNAEAGTFNFDTGVLTLNSLNPIGVAPNVNYEENIFTFSAQPEAETIYPFRNQILTIDKNDSSSIFIQLKPES